MKNLSFWGAIVALLVSCTQTPEEKANVLIKERVKSQLFHPETYDPVETIVDSAFMPFDEPAFYKKIALLCTTYSEIEKCESKVKDAKSSMNYWDDPFSSSFGRNKYKEAKEEYEEALANLEEVNNNVNNMLEDIKQYMQKEKHFIGYKVKHRYRASTNSGNTVFGATEFLINQDFTRIVYEQDMDGLEYQTVHLIIENIINGADGNSDILQQSK